MWRTEAKHGGIVMENGGSRSRMAADDGGEQTMIIASTHVIGLARGKDAEF